MFIQTHTVFLIILLFILVSSSNTDKFFKKLLKSENFEIFAEKIADKTIEKIKKLQLIGDNMKIDEAKHYSQKDNRKRNDELKDNVAPGFDQNLNSGSIRVREQKEQSNYAPSGDNSKKIDSDQVTEINIDSNLNKDYSLDVLTGSQVIKKESEPKSTDNNSKARLVLQYKELIKPDTDESKTESDENEFNAENTKKQSPESKPEAKPKTKEIDQNEDSSNIKVIFTEQESHEKVTFTTNKAMGGRRSFTSNFFGASNEIKEDSDFLSDNNSKEESSSSSN